MYLLSVKTIISAFFLLLQISPVLSTGQGIGLAKKTAQPTTVVSDCSSGCTFLNDIAVATGFNVQTVIFPRRPDSFQFRFTVHVNALTTSYHRCD
jgi:hypothetical protein